MLTCVALRACTTEAAACLLTPEPMRDSAAPLRSQAVAVEADIRKSGVAMSELEYTLLLTAMTGCVRGADPAPMSNADARTNAQC